MRALTRWVLSHKLIVAVAWLLITVIGIASASSATNALSQKFNLPGREGFAANEAIIRLYGNGADSNPIIPVLTLPPGTTVDSPGVKAQLSSAFSKIASAVPRARIASFASTGSSVFVSHDRRTTFAVVAIPYPFRLTDPLATRQKIEPVLVHATVSGAHFHMTGLDALAQGSSGGGGPGVLAEAMLGGVGALLVLIFVFRSFMALVPLFMAVVAIPTTFLLVWGLTTITDVSFIVQFLVALVGLGIAIDYSLIIVLRWREELSKGLDNQAAVQKAMETAGRAVIFSGTTVAIGLLALVVLPVPFLRSLGIGGLLIPLVSVVVAITLLPVALATVGPRFDWPRFGDRSGQPRFWTLWGGLMVRRRWLAAAAGVVILAALVGAASTIALGQSKADSLSRSGDAYQGLAALERSGIGPGVLSPFEILVKNENPNRVAQEIAPVQGVLGAVAPSDASWHRAGTSIVEAFPKADASSSAGRATVDRIRQVFPVGNKNVRTAGSAPLEVDFISAVYGNFPLMIALIALVSFLLLVRAFRSVLLPLKAVLLNVLSVAAAWGVLVLIWQNGFGSKLIWGVPSTGSITFWIPLMVFAFLFGLSMDYEVFILSRMREEFDSTHSTNTAVVAGIGRTGRLVTSAALILFFAFLALASGPQTDIKVMGTGLGAGILLDATVVRMLLVPSLISLFGRWNWWLPALPARLLRVQPSNADHPGPPWCRTIESPAPHRAAP
jgi:putative drug exporter of the RND superfamily